MDLNKKKCVYCGEEIEVNAGRCPHCGSLLNVDAGEFSPQDRIQMPRVEGIEVNETDDIRADNINTSENSLSNVIEKNNGDYNSSEQKVNTEGMQFSYNSPSPVKKMMGNGLKVFLTIITVIIPFLGQLAGIIMAIVFMNSQDDEDRRSFGVALLVASVVFFMFSSMFCILLGIAVIAARGGLPY